ncbi:hypothetical protein B0T20DRAFT_397565 [Sordaria brevicollis]|uniref:Uncharacterized protein n=1 Tax=Sordaria brevicollis TaxID=83679 RepID=A0AAE0NVN4_SORBR|nr:hypothetical protein B0T20DRAFT_397565 [Sordaria brevicollis]
MAAQNPNMGSAQADPHHVHQEENLAQQIAVHLHYIEEYEPNLSSIRDRIRLETAVLLARDTTTPERRREEAVEKLDRLLWNEGVYHTRVENLVAALEAAVAAAAAAGVQVPASSRRRARELLAGRRERELANVRRERQLANVRAVVWKMGGFQVRKRELRRTLEGLERIMRREADRWMRSDGDADTRNEAMRRLFKVKSEEASCRNRLRNVEFEERVERLSWVVDDEGVWGRHDMEEDDMEEDDMEEDDMEEDDMEEDDMEEDDMEEDDMEEDDMEEDDMEEDDMEEDDMVEDEMEEDDEDDDEDDYEDDDEDDYEDDDDDDDGGDE